MCNEKIRNEMKQNGFYRWQVADAMGVSEGTLNRWLRHELEPEKKAAVMTAIEKCKEARKDSAV